MNDPLSRTNLRPSQNLKWERFKFPGTLYRYGGVLAALTLVFYSIDVLNIRLDRVLGFAGRFVDLIVNRYYPPDLEYITNISFFNAVVDTFNMALVGSAFGLILAVPLSWLASYNMSPEKKVLYPAARFIIMACRSVHETIWTILFVTIVGFGLLPGVLAMTVFTIGFAGKLMTEEIETVKNGPLEAIIAAGGNNFQTFFYAVIPQVQVAWTGIAIYAWDVAFRAATIIGFFGAGGLGWYLKRNIQQLESERVAAILLSIIIFVIIAEVFSAWARDKVSNAGGEMHNK